jgi:glycogen operon protein
VDFVRLLSIVRREHPEFRRETFLKGTPSRTGVKDVSWLHVRGGELTQNDWSDLSLRTFGALLGNRHNTVHRLLVLFNAGDAPEEFPLPAPAPGARWRRRFDTARFAAQGLTLEIMNHYPLAAHSAALLEC